ncbi:uncharacterized protein LTR77_001831 [Saxophila tyrrhenica]|uniref:CAF1-domain-containing protein n=1 Tax=Saxophila tyrrhenica TaxID=1690608 RepID=A0AAV9PLJ0_9PEZI|nr:hypothetical protein LTR77_001831 [Saxophila tyrrhenica]
MEVDKVSFYPLLLDILTDISEAHFVAFDLELSGVPTKQARSGKDGKPTLQERYLETKAAAERYQILQIGLTCVEQDIENQKYVLKPYNFELSPLIEESRLDIERIFSFQSGAAEFLLKTGFNLSVPFERGVPYLSRLETTEAREKYAKRQDRSAIPDLQIKPTETESLAFLERVRTEINKWRDSRDFDALNYINISAVDLSELTEDDVVPELSRYEKRLVHQLVRAEYPELISIGKRSVVQIIPLDPEHEARIAEGRKRDVEERINRQKGFRWIIEALHGSEITDIDLRECARDPVTGEAVFADMDAYKAQFHRAQNLMRNNPKIMVGHNCFLDLVYIYRTFVGELPDTVEGFQELLHAYWPTIIDTKYMSTHNCGDINPVSALDQIAAQLSEQPLPTLEIDPEHKKYKEEGALHEAGFDSFLTAQIAVRLSSKLEKDGSYVDLGPVTPTMNGTLLDGDMTPTMSSLSLTSSSTEDDSEPAELPEIPFVPSVQGGKWKRRGDPSLGPQDPNDPFAADPRDLKHRHIDPEATRKGRVFEGGMPGWGSDFWRVYGNRLRVFGTEEAMCVLDGSGGLADGEDGVDGGVGI